MWFTAEQGVSAEMKITLESTERVGNRYFHGQGSLIRVPKAGRLWVPEKKWTWVVQKTFQIRFDFVAALKRLWFRRQNGTTLELIRKEIKADFFCGEKTQGASKSDFTFRICLVWILRAFLKLEGIGKSQLEKMATPLFPLSRQKRRRKKETRKCNPNRIALSIEMKAEQEEFFNVSWLGSEWSLNGLRKNFERIHNKIRLSWELDLKNIWVFVTKSEFKCFRIVSRYVRGKAKETQ